MVQPIRGEKQGHRRPPRGPSVRQDETTTESLPCQHTEGAVAGFARRPDGNAQGAETVGEQGHLGRGSRPVDAFEHNEATRAVHHEFDRIAQVRTRGNTRAGQRQPRDAAMGRGQATSRSRKQRRSLVAEDDVVDEPRRADSARHRKNGTISNGREGGKVFGLADFDVVD